jgi:phosphoserine phosphatase RsbU/P
MTEPRLEVTDPLGRRFVVINKPTFSIGRRSSNDLVLAGTDISRDHAEIIERGGRYTLRDRGSQGGTVVNGVEITEHPLAHGDRIGIGRSSGVELLFMVDDRSSSSIASGAAVGAGLRQIAALLEALRGLGGARVLDEVLTLVMDTAIDVTGAERGFIMLATPDGQLELKLARMRGQVSMSGSSFDTSRKIPEEVFASGEGRIIADLHDGGLAQMHGGTIALGIRHVLCVPLRIIRYVDAPQHAGEMRAIGVLYLDSREKGTILSDTARTALDTIASEAAAAIENARLYREAAEKMRLDQELRIASQIQQSLLTQARKDVGFCQAVGASVACRAIGGDFFEYLDLPDGGFGFALGDVSGKGPPAALLTAMLQGIFSAHAFVPIEPKELLARVNRVLIDRGVESRFATVFFGVITRDGTLTYCNAGHNPPLLFRRGGMERLETGGMIVGLFPDATYEQGTIQFSPGDLLVLFSDGVSEALDAAGEEFGELRIRDVVGARRGESAESGLQALMNAVKEFARGAVQNDDVTAMLVKYLGQPDSRG